MIGSAGNARDSIEKAHQGCIVHLKVAELGHPCPWVMYLLQPLGVDIPFKDELVTAGHRAMAFHKRVHEMGDTPSTSECQELFDHMPCFLVQLQEACVHCTFKAHHMMHLVHRTNLCYPHAWGFADDDLYVHTQINLTNMLAALINSNDYSSVTPTRTVVLR